MLDIKGVLVNYLLWYEPINNEKLLGRFILKIIFQV